MPGAASVTVAGLVDADATAVVASVWGNEVGNGDGVATVVAAAVTETNGEGVAAGEIEGCGEGGAVTAAAGATVACACGACVGSATAPAPELAVEAEPLRVRLIDAIPAPQQVAANALAALSDLL